MISILRSRSRQTLAKEEEEGMHEGEGVAGDE